MYPILNYMDFLTKDVKSVEPLLPFVIWSIFCGYCLLDLKNIVVCLFQSSSNHRDDALLDCLGGCFLQIVVLLRSDEFLGGQKDHLSEGNQLTENQPIVDKFGVGGVGQLFHHADEDGRHHKHVRQVHCQGSLEEEGFEEGGGKGDCQQKKGREVGDHDLAEELSLHHNQNS